MLAIIIKDIVRINFLLKFLNYFSFYPISFLDCIIYYIYLNKYIFTHFNNLYKVSNQNY